MVIIMDVAIALVVIIVAMGIAITTVKSDTPPDGNRSPFLPSSAK